MKHPRIFHWALLALLPLAACGRSSPATQRAEKNGQITSHLGGSKIDGPPICTQTDLSTCAARNLATEACLTLYQACGRSQEIIEHYRSEAWSTDASKDYYLGAAYHSLFLQTRSAAAKCQFGTSARLALQSFLNQSYQNQGYNDQRRFQQTYHATKLLEAVKAIEGCEEDGMTRDELFYATYSHGKALAEGLFVGDVPPGPLQETLSTLKTTIQTSIQSFVSAASNIVTQIGLRKVAMDASDARIEKIAKLLESGFGATVAVSRDANGNKPRVTEASMPAGNPFAAQQKLYARESEGQLHKEATKKLDALKKALGDSDISAYEQKRGKIIQFARESLISSAKPMQQATGATPNDALDSLSAKIANATGTAIDDGSGALQTMKAAWRAYGERTHACSLATPPWYCQ